MLKADFKKVFAVAVWAVFTLSLLTWWIIFSFRQLSQLQEIKIELSDKILRHQKMILYEGITLFLCLGVGALFLLYYVNSENSRLKERRDFFSAFTHDLKTSIAVLRLKLEKLSCPEIKEVQEVQKIGTRLSIQLQNALQLSYLEDEEVLLEKISILKEIDFIKGLWPELSFSFKGDHIVQADRIALRSIINNIIQNSVEHAEAKAIFIEQSKAKNNMINISFATDGKPHQLDSSEVEKGEFKRRSQEGTGLGLKISINLMKKMGGKMYFSTDEGHRLKVHMNFVGESLS